MSIAPQILKALPQLQDWRRHIHKHPETAFEENKTSAFVKEKLLSFGIEVHEGFAKTGLVGVLKNGTSPRKIAIRADMDALPMQEYNTHEWKSCHEGKMHGCGHDGHTTIVLGVAQYLSQSKNFDGTVYFYFQPAEEAGGGANVMIQDGLFEQFKPDEVYALHNMPKIKAGQIAYRHGALLAAPDIFYITIDGVGGHAAYPHRCKDSIQIGMLLGTALQGIVARGVNPLESAVVSITTFHAGQANNVIPAQAKMSGTVRTFDKAMQANVKTQMQNIIDGFAKAYGIQISLRYEYHYPATINDHEATDWAIQAAKSALGEDNVVQADQTMGGEDFSYMLEYAKGCMVFLGNGDTQSLHHPHYDFNDEIIGNGVAFFSTLVEQRLAL